MPVRLLVVVIVTHFVSQSQATFTYQGGSKCPCSNPDWCKPVQVQYKKEVFAFSDSDTNWNKYDWDKMTSISMSIAKHDPQLTCYAHSKGVRVTREVDIPTASLTNVTARSIWVAEQVQDIIDNFLDGVNVDYEGSIPPGRSDLRQGLTDLVAELRPAIRKNNPLAQITFDSAVYPTTPRSYDYVAIGKIVDFFFVMAYDESWECKAWANSALNVTVAGINEYINLGIPANKLVLGVPWYGYDYPCAAYNKTDHACSVDNCGGKQHCLFDIEKYFPFVDVLWDVSAASPYFTYKSNTTGQTHQVWFDNVKSLKIKYDEAGKMNLRGVGIFQADCLDYSNATQVAAMWGALPDYKKKETQSRNDIHHTYPAQGPKHLQRNHHKDSTLRFKTLKNLKREKQIHTFRKAHVNVKRGKHLLTHYPAKQADSGCPCSNPEWCKPLKTQHEKEIFTFSTSDDHWNRYDWNKITTVVLFNNNHDPLLTCDAHSKGVKVTTGADFPTANLTSSSARSVWVAAQVQSVQERYLDGVNVDFEDSIPANRPDLRQGLTDLVAELTNALRKVNPQAQVTFDSPWHPSLYQDYDFLAIANIVDFILVMSYDEVGSCRAWANSGLNNTAAGLKFFMGLGIPPKKLVVGVPWYGYDYPCSAYYKSDHTCKVDNCGGTQRCFSDIVKTFLSSADVLWDDKAASPYFSYTNKTSGQIHQVWFDNAKSLKIKSDMAVNMDLRGVGMWQADCLDYLNTPQVADMWGSLPNYKKGSYERKDKSNFVYSAHRGHHRNITDDTQIHRKPNHAMH